MAQTAPRTIEPTYTSDLSTEHVAIDPNLPWAVAYKMLLGTVRGTRKGIKQVKGVEGWTIGRLQTEIANGGKFVIYPYAVSMIIMSFKQPSPIIFVRAGEGRVAKGLPYSAISLFLGWWGFPWGFIFTPQCLSRSLRGGVDVTSGVTPLLIQHSLRTAGYVAPQQPPQPKQVLYPAA